MSDLLIHPPELKKICLRLIRENLLAALNDGTAQVALPEVFARRSSTLIETVTKRPVRSSDPHVAQHWPEAGLWSGIYPLVCCVTGGEADFVVGDRGPLRPSGKTAPGKSGVSRSRFDARALHLPARSFLVVPPGTPIPDGTRPHWERPQPENAFSEILWLHFLPSGVTVHLCRTSGTSHGKSWSLFIVDSRLSFLAETMIEDLHRDTPAARTAASQLLAATLLRMSDKLADGPAVMRMQEAAKAAADLQHPSRSSHESATLLVKRATTHVKEHLNEALTVERIAAYSYASPSHLNRIFRQELKLSVMGFVMRERLETACSLLRTTDLAISEVGQYVGYHDPTHFSHVFMKSQGISPSEFRRRAKAVHSVRAAKEN